MTPAEINREIALLLGWVVNGSTNMGDGNLYKKPLSMEFVTVELLPNWYGDLNACAEFEASLNSDEQLQYASLIDRQKIVSFQDDYTNRIAWKLITATAPQRCQAYLTLKGKWREMSHTEKEQALDILESLLAELKTAITPLPKGEVENICCGCGSVILLSKVEEGQIFCSLVCFSEWFKSQTPPKKEDERT